MCIRDSLRIVRLTQYLDRADSTDVVFTHTDTIDNRNNSTMSSMLQDLRYFQHDFSAAFDCTEVNILLQRLEHNFYFSLLWLCSYLSSLFLLHISDLQITILTFKSYIACSEPIPLQQHGTVCHHDLSSFTTFSHLLKTRLFDQSLVRFEIRHPDHDVLDSDS